jgi:mannose-6-phosphate isomerase-like protein (cupin superfamily)
MDALKIVKNLESKYPGKRTMQLPEENPREIICEVEPTEQHPDWSVAVAFIDKSISHVHNKSTEAYEVLEGKLILSIGNEKRVLKKREKFIVQPGQVHQAEGKETKIRVFSSPGWTAEDHVLKG